MPRPKKSPQAAPPVLARAPSMLTELAQRAVSAGAGGVLLPYQQQWLADPARVKVFEKSRRIGITWATAANAVIEAASGRTDVWYVVYSEEAAKEFIRDAAKWAERFSEPAEQLSVELIEYDEKGEAKGSVRALQVTFVSGKRITALTSNPRGLRGKAGLVVIDEAAYIDDLEDVLKSAFALLMWGGEVHVLSTHNGSANPFALLCDDIRDGKKDHALHRCTITDALTDGLYRRIAMATGASFSLEAETDWLAELERDYGDGAREELHVVPDGGGASYIHRDLVRAAMYEAPVLRFAMPEGAREMSELERESVIQSFITEQLAPELAALATSVDVQTSCVGMDFGRVRDLSVIAPMCIEQNLCRRVPFMVELDQVPFNQQWSVLRAVFLGLPYTGKMSIDATGSGGWIGEQAVHEFGADRAEAVMLNIAYYRDHMPGFRRVFEEGTIRLPRDLDIATDLSAVTRINGVPRIADARTDSASSRSKRHADAAIALFLANVAADAAVENFMRWTALTTF